MLLQILLLIVGIYLSIMFTLFFFMLKKGDKEKEKLKLKMEERDRKLNKIHFTTDRMNQKLYNIESILEIKEK